MLAGAPSAFVNADVALDGEPVIGSFTVDGLTFAVTDDASVELVGVSEGSSVKLVGVVEAEGAFGSEVPTSPQPPSASTPEAEGLASEVDGSTLALPESVTYGDAEYVVASIGAYAFYLSGVTSVELPASVADVDERAFRSSDVSSVEVAEGNPAYSSFDGALYDAGQSSLLLIPEGRLGAVRMPSTVMAALPSAFSHCAGVDAITVDADGAAFASENGLLYDASLETLLRVPAGATDITIREGCITIAAGAMEGCAKLSTINAPASVTSISPDVFTSVPTVSLPVSSVADDAEESSQADEAKGAFGSEVPTSPQPPSASSAEASNPAGTQLTALVALSTTDDDLPEIDSSAVKVFVREQADLAPWIQIGFALSHDEPVATAQSAASFAATLYYGVRANDGMVNVTYDLGTNYEAGDRLTMVGYSTGGAHGNLYLYDDGTFILYGSDVTGTSNINQTRGYVMNNHNLAFRGWTRDLSLGYQFASNTITITASQNNNYYVWPVWHDTFAVSLDACTPEVETQVISATFNKDLPFITAPTRPGYFFAGYYDADGVQYFDSSGGGIRKWDKTSDATLYAKWDVIDFNLGFDVDTEPGDEDYPGIEKPDEAVNVESGPTVIEDPKRPGYVFQGWTIPNAEGTEAIDQDLVYQDETDGKWYVNASKLPDYADDSGRVELTARWTSVISVDVPSAVTFYADVVTQGNESREGAASSAFGQNKVASQSEVDLRIVGLESNAVETQGSTLGADSILKKAASATLSSSTQKLFSLYPTSKALTPDDLQDPDAVSATKPADAVDFALDDLLLEKSFAADKFTIPAGDTLNLGYRLNLSETGTELDYEKLSTLDEGQSASIANISYCFATMLHHPTATGSTSDDLYIEHKGRIYGLDDIKASADCIAAFGEESPCYQLYSSFMASGMDPGDSSDAHGYVRWGDGTVYSVRIIGISYDDKADASGKASLTFEFVNLLNTPYQMRSDGGNAGGWGASLLRDQMNPYSEDELLSASGTGNNSIWDDVPMSLRQALVPVGKKYYRTYSNLNTLSRSSDYLFIRGLGETCVTFISASTWPNELPFLHGERPDDCSGPYQYFAMLGINQTVSESINLVSCGYEKSPAIPARHWQRSLYVDYPHTFCSFEKYGSGSINETLSTNFFGVRPAFCL